MKHTSHIWPVWIRKYFATLHYPIGFFQISQSKAHTWNLTSWPHFLMIKLLSHGIMDTLSHLLGFFNRTNLDYTSEMRMTAREDWHNLAAHPNHRKNSQISLFISGIGQTRGTLNYWIIRHCWKYYGRHCFPLIWTRFLIIRNWCKNTIWRCFTTQNHLVSNISLPHFTSVKHLRNIIHLE